MRSNRILRIQQLGQRLCMAFGDLDLNFGSGGEVETSFLDTRDQVDLPVSLSQQSDGLLATFSTIVGSGRIHGVAKLDLSGELQQTFGNRGFAYFDLETFRQATDGTQSDFVRTTHVLPSGRVLWASTNALTATFQDRIDTSFGNQGRIEGDFQEFHDLSDGGFLAVWTSGFISRYSSQGFIDRTFGREGYVRIANSDNESIQEIRVNPDDSFVVLKQIQDADASTMESSLYQSNGQFIRVISSGPSSDVPQELTPTRNGFLKSELLTGQNGTTIVRVSQFDDQMELDPTFGIDGAASLALPNLSGAAQLVGVMVADNGAVTVVLSTDSADTEIAALRLTAAGNPDPTFGQNGVSFIRTNQSLTDIRASLNADDSVSLIAASNLDIAYLRIDPAGAAPLQSGASLPSFDPSQSSRAIRDWQIQSIDGKRWVSKSTVVNVAGGLQTQLRTGDSETGREDPPVTLDGRHDTVFRIANDRWLGISLDNGLVITRYAVDGTPDDTFGTNGQQVLDGVSDFRASMGRDGSITIAGLNPSGAVDVDVVSILRFSPQGEPVTSFGNQGMVSVDAASIELKSVAHASGTGTLLLVSFRDATDADPQTTLVAFDETGRRNESFGQNGIAANSGLAGVTGDAKLATDEQGNVLVLTQTGGLQVRRFTTSGTLDTGFGTDGSVVVSIQLADSRVSLSVARGVISVGGTQVSSGNTLRVVSYDYQGNALSEFGPVGVRDYEFSSDGEVLQDIAFMGDNSLLIAVVAREGADALGKLVRVEGSATIPMHNFASPADVDGNNVVSPLDALRILNDLDRGTRTESFFPDVNDDGRLSAIDALLVVNQLHRNQFAEAELVGSGATLSPASSVDSAFLDSDWLDESWWHTHLV